MSASNGTGSVKGDPARKRGTSLSVDLMSIRALVGPRATSAGRWAVLACAFACALVCSPVSSQTVPTGLEQAVTRAHVHFDRLNDPMAPAEQVAAADACLAELAPWREAAWAANQANMGFVQLLFGCLNLKRLAEGQKLAVDQVLAEQLPWVQHRTARRPAEPRAAALFDMGPVFWNARLLQRLGFVAEGTAHLLAEANRHLDLLEATPGDAYEVQIPLVLASGVFGAWKYQDEVRALQALFERRLGEGHRANLLTLRALAYHERFLGRPRAALTLIARASALTATHWPQDTLLNAHMATEHAACLASNGRWAQARRQMLAAREVFAAQPPTAPGRDTNLTRTAYNLAGFSMEMGDLRGAIQYADEAIEQARASGDFTLSIEARVPRATREVARLLLGEPDAAERLHAVLTETGTDEMHIGGHAFALTSFAARNGNADLLQWAATLTDKHIHRYSAPLQSDAALRPLMQAWQRAGYGLQDPTARELLDQSLTISLSGRSTATLALTQFSLARHLASPQADAAIWLYKRGANALQKLRQGLPENDAELHRAWLSAHESDLRDFVGLLINEGRLAEAEQALQLLRDEETFEYARRAAEPGAATQPLSYTAAETQRNTALAEIERQVDAAARAADERLDAKGTQIFRNAYVDPAANAQLAELTTRVHAVLDAPPVSLRGAAAAAGIPGRRPPARAARLVYLVREAQLDIVVQTRSGGARHSVSVSRAVLNQAVQRARGALATAQFDARPALQALWRLLIQPVQAQLTGVEEVEVIPDAALRYVPFAALHDGRRYLAERVSISTRWAGSTASTNTNTTTTTNGAAARPTHRGVFALGRSAGDANHSALPGVSDELALLRQRGAVVVEDSDFNTQALTDGLARRPAIVHLATHFKLDPAAEDASYLLLGDGQHLSLTELSKLPWQGVQLAVLSACDSAVTLDGGPGRELIGFACSLQRAGVAHVLATLWRVADGETARWMGLFYGQGRAAMPKASSVAVAQRAWLRRFAGQPLAHPHYWAGFTWLGGER